MSPLRHGGVSLYPAPNAKGPAEQLAQLAKWATSDGGALIIGTKMFANKVVEGEKEGKKDV